MVSLPITSDSSCPWARISTVAQIWEGSLDVRVTAWLNKFHIELLEDKPDWANRTHVTNHFIVRQLAATKPKPLLHHPELPEIDVVLGQLAVGRASRWISSA
jgi:hypothetical protein